MFTQGQLIFAGIAFVLFVVLMFFSYRSDRKRDKKYFKNSYLIAIAFIALLVVIYYIKMKFK